MTSPTEQTVHTRLRAGFTLAEMIVVSVVLVIIMSMTIPRVTATGRRSFDLAVEQVTDLLTMYAHRDAVASSPVGLRYDPQRRALLVMVLGEENDRAESAATWTIDPFVRPVILPEDVDADAMLVLADGEPVNLSDRTLSHSASEHRPSLEVSLQSTSGAFSATLVLAPHAIAPLRREPGTVTDFRAPVDLDATGRSREDW